MKPTGLVITFLFLAYFYSCTTNPGYEESQAVPPIDSVEYYSDLAQAFYETGNLDSSRLMYLKMSEFHHPDSLKLTDVILRKRLFFVPDTFKVPGELIKESFVLKPLRTIHAEMDYQAVMSSVDHLTGVIGRGDWPGDLTLEENRYALAGHEWEFKNRIGFVYTVMNKSETEVIGCVYIYPSRLDDFDSEVVLWVTGKEFNRGTDDLLYKAIIDWMEKEWPFENIIYPGREVSWGIFFETLDKQDEKYL
jgi:hypothetical protein